MTASSIPVVDIAALLSGTTVPQSVAQQICAACRSVGFFYVVGHAVDTALQQRLVELSQLFFAQDLESKMRIRMALGGRAWRGYFPVGDELTSGLADRKEGLYFGAELDSDHPLVRAGTPLHGRNLFPPLSGFRDTVLDYMRAMTQLGHALMRGIAVSLDLDQSYFRDHYTADPLILFRIFHYPPQAENDPAWGVGEHTDYGLLTILKQGDAGGLQVKSRGEWIDAPPIADSFVCNIGDMLDRMTAGYYRSNPHRVRNQSKHGRLSFPFFFDPSFAAHIHRLDVGTGFTDDKDERWDHASVHAFEGTYGDYILAKVAKVFPALRRESNRPQQQ